MAEKKQTITLATPVTIGEHDVVTLNVTVPFRNGFLRGAPPTPQWFITTVQTLMTKAGEIGAPKPDDVSSGEPTIDDLDFLKGVDLWPKGSDIDAMLPWLMHIAEKATGEPADVIDQLALDDMMKILATQLPGMMKLANFRATSANGAVTSPGSSGGAPQK